MRCKFRITSGMQRILKATNKPSAKDQVTFIDDDLVYHLLPKGPFWITDDGLLLDLQAHRPRTRVIATETIWAGIGLSRQIYTPVEEHEPWRFDFMLDCPKAIERALDELNRIEDLTAQEAERESIESALALEVELEARRAGERNKPKVLLKDDGTPAHPSDDSLSAALELLTTGEREILAAILGGDSVPARIAAALDEAQERGWEKALDEATATGAFARTGTDGNEIWYSCIREDLIG